MYKVSFNNKNSVFYSTLKNKVEEYFRSRKIKKTGNWKLYSKATILIPSALSIYLILLFVPLAVVPGLLLCAFLGFIFASIGFNVMHDACHGSYCSKKWVNEVLGLSINTLGGNAFIWKQKHNIIHHTYTNIEGVDDDIAQSKFIRQSPTQPWMRVHKWQHIYLPLIYSLTIFAWALARDYGRYFSKKIHTTPIQYMSRKEHVIFWVSKVLYILFYIIIPIVFVGFVPWLIGFLIMGTVLGLTLAFVFQLAHAVEGTEFEAVGLEAKTIEGEWAAYQVRTTANFATNNKIISWFVGGLNFQIEHHLFPRMSHVHYPAISRIVKQTCNEYDLPYNQFSTMWQALVSHFKIMKQLGQKPVPAISTPLPV